MKQSTFVARVTEEKMIEIPVEVREKLYINPGDAVEISIKKIKPRRLEILISQNPLYKLLQLPAKIGEENR